MSGTSCIPITRKDDVAWERLWHGLYVVCYMLILVAFLYSIAWQLYVLRECVTVYLKEAISEVGHVGLDDRKVIPAD